MVLKECSRQNLIERMKVDERPNYLTVESARESMRVHESFRPSESESGQEFKLVESA